jgi:hypothetical protein
MTRRSMVILVLILLGITTTTGTAEGLLMQAPYRSHTVVSLRFTRPHLLRDKTSRFSGLYDLELNLPLNDDMNLLLSIPIIVARYPDSSGRTYRDHDSGLMEDYNQWAFGSYFAGMQFTGGSWFGLRCDGTLGAFFTVTAADRAVAVSVGEEANPLEFQKGQRDYWSIYTNIATYLLERRNFLSRFDLGIDAVWPAYDERPTGPTSLRLHYHYALFGNIRYGHVNGFVEYFNSSLTNGDNLEFLSSESSNRFISFGVSLLAGRFEPAFGYIFPLTDDAKTTVDNIVGAKFDLHFNS